MLIDTHNSFNHDPYTKRTMPQGACDCHTHIHANPDLYPFVENRKYTPDEAPPEALASLHKELGIERVIIVNPSVYGSSNAATAAGIRFWGENARGVASITPQTTLAEMAELWSQGFRGVRSHLIPKSRDQEAVEAAGLRALAMMHQIEDSGMHLQIQTTLPVISALKNEIKSFGCPIVFEHFAFARPHLGFDQPGFNDLLELLAGGHAYIKLSCAYRISRLEPTYEDVISIARELIAANENRVIWGTDWPHTNPLGASKSSPQEQIPYLEIDDKTLLDQLQVWAPTAEAWLKILVKNPAELYGF